MNCGIYIFALFDADTENFFYGKAAYAIVSYLSAEPPLPEGGVA